jgi:hypothetical protein
MKSFLFSVILIFSFLFTSAARVYAPLPVVMAPPSSEVDELLALDVSEYLDDGNFPAETNIYAISGVSLGDGGTYVSLVGLDPDTPAPYDWNYENETIIWEGSLFQTGGVFSVYVPTRYPTIEAASGGGADVAFPWAIGSKMMFGPRGIHGGQNNAVDWVSGDDLGEGAAGPEVYASADGEIINVCEDNTQMGITVDGPNYRFGYLHLEKDSNLTVGKAFVRGDYIGRLKYGKFTDTCGYADQAPNHYHLHWTFQPENGIFKAESWILYYNTSEWKRGNETVKVNQWMTGGGGIDNPTDPGDPGDPTVPVSVPRFWTYILTGVRSIYNKLLAVMPDSLASDQSHASFGMARSALADLISMANIFLVGDVINFMPVIYVYLALFIIRWLLFLPGVVFWILQLIKKIPFL